MKKAVAVVNNSRSNFWTWSLDRYERNGVATALLQMQDECDFNINIALWCCWCAEQYEETPDLALRNAIETTGKWNSYVTSPLRKARRFLKTTNTTDDLNLASQIKDAELVAEKVEQTQLEELAEKTLTKADGGSVKPLMRARRNLIAYAGLIGAAKKEGFSVSLLESLINSIFEDDSMTAGVRANP